MFHFAVQLCRRPSSIGHRHRFPAAIWCAVFLALLSTSCTEHSNDAVKPPLGNWTCSGNITYWRTGQPIAGVQVTAQDTLQTASDLAGHYSVTLGPRRVEPSSIRFAKAEFVDVIAQLDTAAVVGERSLQLDIVMYHPKDIH